MHILPLTILLLLTLSGGYMMWTKGMVYAVDTSVAISPPPQATPQAQVQDHTLKLVSDGVDVLSDFPQLRFASRSSALIPDVNSQEFIGETAEYVRADPTRHLLITGYYLAAEHTSSTRPDQSDLGLARARSIRDALVNRAVPTSQITIAAAQLDDVSLSKSAEFLVTTSKAKVPPIEMGYK